MPVKLRPLYNRQRQCVAYCRQAGRTTLHLPHGELIAEIDDGAVFSLDGRHLGWMRDGCIYNYYGGLVLSAQGGQAVPAGAPQAAMHADAQRAMAAADDRPSYPRRQRQTAAFPPALGKRWAPVSGLAFLMDDDVASGTDGTA